MLTILMEKHLNVCEKCPIYSICPIRVNGVSCSLSKMIERLTAYEQTGMSPEEIHALIASQRMSSEELSHMASLRMEYENLVADLSWVKARLINTEVKIDLFGEKLPKSGDEK